MKIRPSLTQLAVLGALGALTAAVAPAAASAAPASPPGAVFVQTDGLAGNAIVAYQRNADGTLTEAGTYPTGGLGGQLTGSAVDHTASQGSLAYDRSASLLLAVNAGSNTISVFRVEADRLALRQVLSSGGKFPVSITTNGFRAYVLNAEEGGSIQGYEVLARGVLVPVESDHRALNLPNDLKHGEAEQFTHTPGQIAYNPEGRDLIITTKAAGQSILEFATTRYGLSGQAVVSEQGANVPFAVAFTPGGLTLVSNAGPSSLASFQQRPNGSFLKLDEVDTGQAATCWVTPADGYYYTSNAGSADVTGFSLSDTRGTLVDLGNTPAGGGTVDGAAAGNFLYVQGGAVGTVSEFRVRADGSLEAIGTVTVPAAQGGEGIVAL